MQQDDGSQSTKASELGWLRFGNLVRGTSTSDPSYQLCDARSLELQLRKEAASPGSQGITVSKLVIEGDLDLSGLSLDCSLAFEDCAIKGDFILHDARLLSLCLSQCTVRRVIINDAEVRHSCTIQECHCSSVSLRGSSIGGALSLEGTSLTSMGRCLEATSVSISGSVFLRRGFGSSGPIRFYRASIGASIDFSGARILSQSRSLSAIDLSLVQVEGSVYIRRGAIIQGGVDAVGIKVGSSMDLSGARFTGDTNGVAIDLTDGSIRETLRLEKTTSDGIVCLKGCTVANFYVSEDVLDHEPCLFRVSGFRFTNLANPLMDVDLALRLAGRHDDSTALAFYDQLLYHYRARREMASAYRVGYEREVKRMGLDQGNLASRIFDWIIFLVVGFGYKPLKAAVALALLFLGGVLAYSAAPSDSLIYIASAGCNGAARECFSPALYSLERTLPVVSFGSLWPLNWNDSSTAGLILDIVSHIHSILALSIVGVLGFSAASLYLKVRSLD